MTSEAGNRIPEGGAPRLSYLPALDGLRAVAVMAVLLYHANVAWMPGGFMGVEMFFAISGYLITSLLLVEWSQHGRIDYIGFWLRRGRRLFPALFVFLLVVVAGVMVFLPTELAGIRGDALSTVGYVNNWYQVLSHKSYFETVGRPSLLRHMWSLAVEEQFYLVWPFLFSLLMRGLRPRLVLFTLLAGALASSLLMAALYQPNSDPSRAYYGTDTRAAGLLLGAALAFLWRPGQSLPGVNSRILDGVGLAAMVTLGLCFLFINEFEAFLYRGGFTLVGLATAELMAVAVHPHARLVPRILAWEPLRWIGVRSYGIYLWHFPVFMVTRPQLDVPLDGVPLLLVRFGLTIGIAALSYRWIESPVRNGALGRSWNAWRTAQGHERRQLGLRWATVSLSVVAVISVMGVFLLKAQPPAPPAYLSTASVKEPAITETNAGPAIPSALTAAPPTLVIQTVNEESITAIGDSVMVGVIGELKRALGTNVIIDADQGRLPWNTPAIVRNLQAAGKIHPVVVLHIGNNGFFSSQVFDQIMAELKKARRVVVVNVKAPRRWEAMNNTMLAAASKSYPNVVLVDWQLASCNQPNLFWKDGIHLRTEGARFYADLIAQAVKGPGGKL